ncbi:hypothetical protein HDU96_006856 [Phlyctochytrium bullatum]|nr:hypothetical protein HDU96_006856 [Phlyctochytrium bullatum]
MPASWHLEESIYYVYGATHEILEGLRRRVQSSLRVLTLLRNIYSDAFIPSLESRSSPQPPGTVAPPLTYATGLNLVAARELPRGLRAVVLGASRMVG